MHVTRGSQRRPFSAMNLDQLDHLNIKIFAEAETSIDAGYAIPIFHRWIQESLLDELLIDVADYRHVPAGPGVLLIGHEANYSLDFEGGLLGLLYNRKQEASGVFRDKLLQAYGSALSAANRLENEAAFANKLRFDAGHCEMIVNDRLLAPNTEESWGTIRPALTDFFDGLFGANAYSLEHVGEPRERLRAQLKTHRPIPVSALLDSVVAV